MLKLSRLVVLLTLSFQVTIWSPQIQAAPNQLVVRDEYVVLKDERMPRPRSISTVSVQRQLFDVQLVKRNDAFRAKTIQTSREIAVYDELEANKKCSAILNEDPSITHCSPNLIFHQNTTPNDEYYQGHQSSFLPLRIPDAWDITTGSKSVTVAVIDSGLDLNHPDIVPNLWVNPGEVLNNIDDDGNGIIDDINGLDAVTQTRLTALLPDCNGHGTHVAGTIGAAGNNGTGVTGILWNTNILPIRALNCEGSGESFYYDLSTVAFGYAYIADLKARRGINVQILNLSLGSSTPSNIDLTLLRRLRDLNILVVAASGNESSNNDIIPSYPANYDLDNIVSVASFAPGKKLSSFSNFGPHTVDIAAPGENIFSTCVPFLPLSGFSPYCTLSGTSMAAPHVSGALALLYSQYPYINYHDAINHLYNTATIYPSLQGLLAHPGAPNAFEMVSTLPTPDDCPLNPDKLQRGICGCDRVDEYRDTDKDGVFDCVDECISDPAKSKSGICGCGIPDVDTDNDGTPDCHDACINDPLKVVSGTCGCGVPDTDNNGVPVINCPVFSTLATVVPRKMRVRRRDNLLRVELQYRENAAYIIQADFFRMRNSIESKAATRYYRSTKSRNFIRILRKSTRVMLTYWYAAPGDQLEVSQKSTPVNFVL